METPLFDQRMNLDGLNKAVNDMQEEVSRLVIGQKEMIGLITAAMLAGGHVLIEGMPGVAKTLTARLMARSMDVAFGRIQFTPDLMPSDVLGTNVFNPARGSFEFRKGPVFGQVILIDEVNRAPAKTQAALFEIMEERQVTIDGTSYGLEEPFMVMATQNPVEQEGTYRLPEAQLDRFMFKIKVPYPSEQEELSILQRFHGANREQLFEQVKPVINAQQIRELRQQLQQIVAEEKILKFIAAIVVATRNDSNIFLGASPRASLALLQGAKAVAAMAGRDFIVPDDVLYVSRPVLRHRIILTPEKEMEGVTEDETIDKIIHGIEIPR